MLFIFDMGGVCTNNAAETNGKLYEILGLSKIDFYKCIGLKEDGVSLLIDGEPDLLSLCSDGLIGQKEFWKIFGDRAGKTINVDLWHLLFHPVKKDGTYEIIEKLKKAGHRVVCGTNTMESHYLNHIERGDYLVFDQTYCSHFMGVSKPNLKFWEIIMMSENISAKDCVFIDDKQENVDAANSLGIKGIRFVDSGMLYDEIKEFF